MNGKIKQEKKRENPFVSLGFNIILPSVIMSKADDWLDIDPKLALAVALFFPFGYGLHDFYKSRRFNIFSIIGFVSVLLTGVIGLLNLPKEYIAIKEALMPSLIGLIVFISSFTPHPLIKTLLFNEAIMNLDLINERLQLEYKEDRFRKLLSSSTLKFSFSFLLSAILNYVLACYFISSETGTVAFNKELAQMTFWSYPVIVLPCTIILMITLMGLMKRLSTLTNLSLEEMLAGAPSKEKSRQRK